MNISLSTGLYYKKPFTEILDIIHKSGWKAIELFLNQSSMNIPCNVIKEEIDNRDLKVQSIHAPIRLFTPGVGTEEDFIDQCIEIAGLLDAHYIVTHDIFERDDDGNIYYDDTKHCKAMAAFRGSTKVIMTENMPVIVSAGCRMHDIEYMRDFIAQNGYKITYDVGHAGTCDFDIIKGYEILKPYIRNIHLNDCKDGIEHRILGQGNLPIKELLMTLKADGYKYPLTVEYDFDNKKRNDIKSDEDAIEKLKYTLDYLNKFI